MMNALGNLIATMLKTIMVLGFVGISVFVTYTATGQERFKKEAEERAAYAKDVIEQKAADYDNLVLRYLSGDQQARYYMIGIIRAGRVMMTAYDDWCPPVRKGGKASTPDQALRELIDYVWNNGYEQRGDAVLAEAMMKRNSCDYNDWPELIN